MKKLISLFVILAFLFTLVPASPVSANNDLPPNYGFIPNSWEASVSKVDLVNMEEVARYYTAPREAGDPDVRSWRTNRIAIDVEGNGWVLNTGADAHQYGPSGGLQGQVVRIQANTEDLVSTHEYPDPVLGFGTDDAVQVFDVGGVNDMPRAIAVDADGYIWVGFYGSGELHKYSYDGTDLNIEGTYSPASGTIRYYEMKFAPNGGLFISSRASTPSVSGNFGIYRFDGANFYYEQNFNSPYSLLISEDGIVYATAANDKLRIRDGGGNWSEKNISEASTLRGMAFDGLGNIWIADSGRWSGGNNVFWYELDSDSVNSGYVTLEDGNTPVGVGKDAAGLMWAVCRTDNADNGFIEAINPETKEVVDSIEVGNRPYAYGDFVMPEEPELYEICGYKYADWDGVLIGLEGWEITLEKLNNNGFSTATTTGPDGKYCFFGLEAGTYYVRENLKPGWDQVYPEDNVHELTLPYEGEPLSFDFHNTPEKWCGDETAWAAQAHPGQTRFVDRGNWATYVTVDLKDPDDPEDGYLSFPLYAGQHYLAGMLNVKLDNDTLKVQYTTEIPEGILEHYEEKGGKVYSKEGYCGDWTGLMEYHLHVVDDFDDFNEVRTYNRRADKYINPIPGQFKYKDLYYLTDSGTGWIPVDISEFLSDEIFIAAHAVMQWCGYDCNLLPEFELIETVEVDSAKIDGAESSTILEDGQQYRFVASGTWKNGNVHTAVDAECRLPVGDTEWELSRPRSLRLQVNEEYVQWGEYCSPDNIYTIYFAGQDEKVSFRIVDGMPPVPSWYNDNVGSLSVGIYKINW